MEGTKYESVYLRRSLRLSLIIFRLFSFHAGGETSGKARWREGTRLAEVCAVECGSCLLSVSRLRGLTRAVLVTCSTRGQVTFWDLQVCRKGGVGFG